MICRRRLHRLRSCNKLVLLVVAVLFLGIFLAYRTLNGQDASASQRSSMPSMEKRKPRYQAARQRHKLFNTETRLQVRTHLKEQFNSGLKVNGVKEVLTLLYPATWKSAKGPDEVAILLKDKMLELNLHSPMSCKEISDFQIQGSLGSSNRKYVERLEEPQNSYSSFDGYSNQERDRRQRKLMAIKSQANDVQTKIACMKQIYDATFCGPMGNYLLMREIFLLRFLQHPSLITMYGYCLRGDHISMDMRRKGVVMVMEAGVPMTMSMVASLPWSHRVKLALDVAYLMEYLQSSPLGNVGLPRVQLKDFVLIKHTTLKLTDLDEAELSDKSCYKSSECMLQGSDVGVECQRGHCMGLNQKTNLRVLGTNVLDPLLRQSPPEDRPRVEEILDRIHHLDISPSELVGYLESLVKKYPIPEEDGADSEGFQRLREKANRNFADRLSVKDDIHQEEEDEDEDEEDEDGDINENNIAGRGKPIGGHNEDENPQPENYLRLDSSNFPGQYDYPCSDSRVLWGCVMTFETLATAMEHCNSDSTCRSFVVFSSTPEHESKMTVVFKSKNTGSPHSNLGTTLFIKKKDFPSRGEEPVENKGVIENDIPMEDKEGGLKVKDNEEAKVDQWAKVKEMQECIKRTRANQEDALRSREKRLMAHMGLKGKYEKDWQRAVRIQSVTSFSNLKALTGRGARGGSVLVNYNTSSAGHTVTRAKFMVEEGQRQNHIAFGLVYHIDRLLGLYHTPPAVEGFIRSSVMEKFSANQTWQSTFGSLAHPDGTLRGLFVAPTPKVIKKSELMLEPLTEIVSEVKVFDRTQKVQLEYVLLWWLGHIGKASDLHRGFKGHLIHVDADQGFQEPRVNYDGYFRHCQFPNVVYKMLMCFRCHQDNSKKVCHLGQEVVRRLSAAGLKISDLHIQDLSEPDYPSLINDAASRTLEIVDKCIQDFGRETVLY